MSLQKLMACCYFGLFFCSACLAMASRSRVLLIVDPLDEFNNAAAAADVTEKLNVRLVNMWSKSTAKRLLAFGGDIEPDVAPDPDQSSIQKWLVNHNIQKQDLYGILCESDTGLRTAEEMSELMYLDTSNGNNEARRDKYMMQEALRNSGLNTVNQILTDNWNLAETFINQLSTKFPVVIKPCRGAASVGVMKATNFEEAEKIFKSLLGTPGYANGTRSDAILVQEYITGAEYAVDIVTRDGEHKVVAVWKYDKRPVNDAPFVYYCTELVTEYSADILKLMDYAVGTLDALKVKWGPAHIEIKLDPQRGPILVEANVGRFHGQDFCTLCKICFGYHAVELTIDALLSSRIDNKSQYTNTNHNSGSSAEGHHNEQISGNTAADSDIEVEVEALRRWMTIPCRPNLPTCAARIVHLVSTVEGRLKTSPRHTDHILGLTSLLRWAPTYDGEIGEEIVKTTDLHNTAGYALLIHPEKELVDKDYENIVELQKTMYDVE